MELFHGWCWYYKNRSFDWCTQLNKLQARFTNDSRKRGWKSSFTSRAFFLFLAIGSCRKRYQLIEEWLPKPESYLVSAVLNRCFNLNLIIEWKARFPNACLQSSTDQWFRDRQLRLPHRLDDHFRKHNILLERSYSGTLRPKTRASKYFSKGIFTWLCITA